MDEATGAYPAYYMLNCAHPEHFEKVLEQPWARRIRGLRANASRKSHAELNESTELDIGNPAELGVHYAALKRASLPNLNVVGGCCGTDHRHVQRIAARAHLSSGWLHETHQASCWQFSPQDARAPYRSRTASNLARTNRSPSSCRRRACRSTSAAPASGCSWRPRPSCSTAAGKKIGSHYAGPHWEAADGSKIVGAVKQRADAPAAGNIPWLLLGAKSVGSEGAFSKVTSIQRVATVGGIAPAAGCTEAGAQARVDLHAPTTTSSHPNEGGAPVPDSRADRTGTGTGAPGAVAQRRAN